MITFMIKIQLKYNLETHSSVIRLGQAVCLGNICDFYIMQCLILFKKCMAFDCFYYFMTVFNNESRRKYELLKIRKNIVIMLNFSCESSLKCAPLILHIHMKIIRIF